MQHLILLVPFLITTINSRKLNKEVLLKIAFFVIFVFAAIRANYGNDYNAYLLNFELIHAGRDSQFNGVPVFNWLLTVAPTFNVFIVITSALTIIPVYYLIKNNVKPEYIAAAVFIYIFNPYIFLYSLSAIRQTMAISLFILAIGFASKQKFVLYCITILLASMVHVSAIVLLPVYFIANDKPITRKKLNFFILIVLFFFIFDTLFFELAFWFGETFSEAGQYYHVYLDNITGTSLRSNLITLTYAVYIVIAIPKLKGKTLIFSKLYLVALIFSFFAYKFSAVARFQEYFNVFSVVAIPMVHGDLRKIEMNKILRFIMITALPALMVVIYVLRYYSFFTTELWRPFWEYNTVFFPN